MHVSVIKILGILSLLFLFEYLTLLLHPFIVKFTHHTPVYELLISVLIAALIIPIHHRIEHLIIEKLVHNRQLLANDIIKLKKARFIMKKPSP
jgi:hypothetical protein